MKPLADSALPVGLMVLIVDDDEAIAELWAAVLSRTPGVCATHVNNGTEAIRLAHQLHPDVVLRAELGGPGPRMRTTRGAALVARLAQGFAQHGVATHAVRVNGLVGAVTVVDGRVLSVGSFVVDGGRIVAVDLLADPERIARLTLPPLV